MKREMLISNESRTLSTYHVEIVPKLLHVWMLLQTANFICCFIKIAAVFILAKVVHVKFNLE